MSIQQLVHKLSRSFKKKKQLDGWIGGESVRNVQYPSGIRTIIENSSSRHPRAVSIKVDDLRSESF